MRPPGRPKGSCRRAKHEGNPVRPPGRSQARIVRHPAEIAAPRSWSRWWLAVLPAFVLLNALLTLESRGPGAWLVVSPRLSFELCIAVLALSGWIAWRGRIGPALLNGVAALATFWTGARLVDVLAPAVFGRPVHLYWDGRHGWELLRLAGADQPGWVVPLIAGGCVLALLVAWSAVHVVARWAVRRLAAALAWPQARPAVWIVGAGLVASFAAHPFAGRDTRWFFSLPVAPGLLRQVAMLPAAWSPQAADTQLTPSPRFDTDLARLHGADVLLIFAEAYGVTTLDDPPQAAALADARRVLLQAIRDSGREVVSTRVRSPTFGGGSWLAHAALLTGVDTREPGDYELLLSTRRPSLVSHFKRHGYRTIGWMPGLQRPWPEGGFYGYDRVAGADAIGYRGAAFGYWRIPDQASMALLDAQELHPARPAGAAGSAAPAASPRAPRFVVFPTVTSHAPFRPVAPHVDDWGRLLGADAYRTDQVTRSLAEPVSWLHPTPAYLQSIAYTHRWLAAYLRERAPAGLLTIVIGDHQPVAGVSGAGASWDVPVHIIASDVALLQRFVASGFTPGLTPAGPARGDMPSLTATLLGAFDGRSAPVPHPSAGKSLLFQAHSTYQ